MAKKGFHFDQTLCSGCHSCVMVCKENHHLPQGLFFRHVDSFVGEAKNKPGIFHLSLACNHCEKPVCVEVCPTGAMHVDEKDGTVQHYDDVCIGCQACVAACPYKAPQYREDMRIVQKCDGCYALRAKGIEPDCVTACLMRALTFGDVDDSGTNLANLDYMPKSETEPTTYINKSVYSDGEIKEFLM